MADEPNNVESHTLKLLQEMRKENAARFDAIDKRFEAIDARFDKMQEENLALHAQTRAELASVLEVVVETARTVNAIVSVQSHHSKTLEIIEGDLRVMNKRIQRIEDRTGLVKA